MSEYSVHYYRDEKQGYPVREYLDKLPKAEKAKAFAYIDFLRESGVQMRRPMADYLGGKTGLYELRPKPHRVIYCYVEGKKIILLHAFRKKTDKIPKRELEHALACKEISEVYRRYDMIDYESE